MLAVQALPDGVEVNGRLIEKCRPTRSRNSR